MMRAALILAGGKARRFEGREKALLRFRGREMLSLVLESAQKVCEEIVISVRDERQKELLSHYNHTFVIDSLKNYGPLAGFYAGCKVIKSRYTAVLACDMPFLSYKVLEYIFCEVKGYSCAIPSHKDGRGEPLHAIYKTRETFYACKRVSKKGRGKIYDMIELLKKVRMVPTEEIKKFDPELKTFRNINTLEDLELSDLGI
ncbi:MAG: molybdenum cofactor guanylyltransferase [Candidatus Methanofastidiosia archaeon]